MATDESFQAATDPTGQTVTRKPDQANTEISGRISGVSGAIGRQNDATSEAILADLVGEKPVFIIQDNTGGFW